MTIHLISLGLDLLYLGVTWYFALFTFFAIHYPYNFEWKSYRTWLWIGINILAHSIAIGILTGHLHFAL